MSGSVEDSGAGAGGGCADGDVPRVSSAGAAGATAGALSAAPTSRKLPPLPGASKVAKLPPLPAGGDGMLPSAFNMAHLQAQIGPLVEQLSKLGSGGSGAGAGAGSGGNMAPSGEGGARSTPVPPPAPPVPGAGSAPRSRRQHLEWPAMVFFDSVRMAWSGRGGSAKPRGGHDAQVEAAQLQFFELFARATAGDTGTPPIATGDLGSQDRDRVWLHRFATHRLLYVSYH